MYISRLPDRRVAIIYVLSFGIALFLNFFNADSYKTTWLAQEQYSSFSRHMYEPNTAYYAESVLVPLLARFLDANQTREAYNTLCAFMTIAILPLLARGLMARIRKFSHILILLSLYAVSFIYLRNYWLGYPDPLTIILLNFAALTISPLQVFFCVFLASLAHFSITVASVIGLIALYYASGSIPRSIRPRLILGSGLGLVAGKVFLLIWYSVFSYKLDDRVDFVAHGSTAGLVSGILHFYECFAKDMVSFWMTPGLLFIIVCILLLVYFVIRKRYIYSLALLFSIFVAYAVLFITTDGLRDFATTVSAAYVFSLCEFSHVWKTNHCFNRSTHLLQPSSMLPDASYE